MTMGGMVSGGLDRADRAFMWTAAALALGAAGGFWAGMTLEANRGDPVVQPQPGTQPRVEFGTVIVVVDGVEVVSSCDGFGHRVYVTPESPHRERSITVTDDPACVEAGG